MTKYESQMDSSRFAVSGWDDDLDTGIDPSRDPVDSDARQFLKAAETGDVMTVTRLLDMNHDLVNCHDQEGYTALHRACYGNHVTIVSLLLDRDARINAKTDDQWTPLHSCCRWGSTECAAILLSNGADINAQSVGGQTPLHIAASHSSNYDMIQLLLMSPYIDPMIRNHCDETAFAIAQRSSPHSHVFEMGHPLLDLNKLDQLP